MPRYVDARVVPSRSSANLSARSLNALPVCIVLNRLGMKVLRGSARELKHARRAASSTRKSLTYRDAILSLLGWWRSKRLERERSFRSMDRRKAESKRRKEGRGRSSGQQTRTSEGTNNEEVGIKAVNYRSRGASLFPWPSTSPPPLLFPRTHAIALSRIVPKNAGGVHCKRANEITTSRLPFFRKTEKQRLAIHTLVWYQHARARLRVSKLRSIVAFSLRCFP